MASLFSLSFFLKLVSGEVFIHCLEDDLHENFVSHLMSGLLQAGVEPSLVAVGVLSEKFMPSITRFQIGIVVFTKAYIESSRCVEDLLRIIECHETYGLMIIPVFYDTDQSFLVRVSEENFRNARRAQRRAEAQAKIRITADSGEIYDKRMRPKAKTMQNFSLSRALNRVRNLPTWDESKHSWHAFREAKPREDFIKLARSTVAYCGGLPLALEVLGSYLSKRSENEWRSVLSKLEIIPNTQIQNILRISFDGLCNEMEKDIFLDVCCFFIGKERDYVTEILNGCGLHADIGIKVLIERGLVKIENKNKLAMHHLLRDMGREIVRQTSTMQLGKRSRLWLPKDVLDVLTKNTGTEAIVGLSLNTKLTNSDSFKADAFKEMKTLRFLQLDHVRLTGDYGYLSKQLRCISWQGFSLEHIPNNFYLEGAIVMDFQHSNLRLLWKEPTVLPWLKILNLSHSKYLTETPDFSKLPSLEKLILKHCVSLGKVHQSIGDLHNLLLINLKGCTNLSNLPSETYKLKSLKTLILSGCLKIDIFKEDIMHMKSLKTLISHNTAVKQVPISVVSSKSIGYIQVDEGKGLSRTVLHSIILSWMSHTFNTLYRMRPFRGISPSLASMNVEHNDLVDLAPILRTILNLRTVLVQCVTEYLILQQVTAILEEVQQVRRVTWTTSTQLSNHPFSPYSIQFGGYQEEVFNALRKSIYDEELAARQTGKVFVPSDNYPHWLAYKNEGHSVNFTVPDNFHMDGMILCVEHLSRLGDPTQYLICVLMVNYTKCTIQLFNRETLTSLNDVDWHGVISHMGCGDKLEIFIIFEKGFEVQKTAVYLVCNDQLTEESNLTSCLSSIGGHVGQIDDKESVGGAEPMLRIHI
ncbi:disease resistance protein RUN1 isoform X3 [Vigna angularis]|uniref:disease resistance protein RUN1 isoform X3 n=1 Tax=Phaseolus angularis TaxID=3914 RepID=UPI0022B52EA3|nr:disease resistance protein RUN1 isoform X3 [Vigna angularis]